MDLLHAIDQGNMAQAKAQSMEIYQLRTKNNTLVSALEQIAAGNTMAGRIVFSLTEVVVSYQKIAISALRSVED